MKNVVAKVGVYGDIHLSSKNYGAHRNYPAESLYCFQKITEYTEKHKLTHLIGCGDFSFGRFHTLEYRQLIEKELEKQYKLVNGNRFELFGNHDEAGYGITERDFYISRGLLKPSTNLTLGKLNITMVDYGKHNETPANILDSGDCFNIAIAHDFYCFNNTNIANFGKAIMLDTFEPWFGLDYLVCGHVHKIIDFSGHIIKGELAHELKVQYLGSMPRPSYREGYVDEVGKFLVITIFDDGTLDINLDDVELWPIAESFNLEKKAKEKEKQVEKTERVDISEVVKQLDSHDRNVGNPEDIIKSLEGIDEKYKNKAVELLKAALG